jgi:hypothetical protein
MWKNRMEVIQEEGENDGVKGERSMMKEMER